jgi:hypothetical protein
MSQHKKRRKGRAASTPANNANKKLSPWALLIGLGLVLIAGVFLISRASQPSQSSTESNLSSVPPVAGSPRVFVAQDRIDHGDVKLNATIDSVFTIRNIGDQDLIILGEPRVELVEGC